MEYSIFFIKSQFFYFLLFYLDFDIFLFFEIKGELQRIRNSGHIGKQEKEEYEEDLLLRGVEKIGILGSHFGINRGEKRLVGSGNPEFTNENGIIHIGNGENCFFVPGCFLNLRKLLDLGIIEKGNVHINLGAGVNIQEAIGFVKTSGELGNMTFERFTHQGEIENISIQTGSNCSFAHGASFYPGTRKDINITAGNGVFFGINSCIGSGSKIGENTTIWWNANLGNNVKLGNGVIVGTSSIIKDNIEIPDNCLIQNFMVITPGFEVIEFDEYKKKKNHYVGRKNFVIRLSKNENEKTKQINDINSNYNFVKDFNLHNVVPENKIFAAVEDIYYFLEQEIGFESTIIYEYEANEKRFENMLNASGINESKEKINGFRNIQRTSRIVLKAYPKNAERFLISETPTIIKMIEDEKKSTGFLSDDIKKNVCQMMESFLDRPYFDRETLKNYFFGNTYITGKFHFHGESLFFNLKSRGDELQENESIQIHDSIILGGIIHGGGNKTIVKSIILDTTIHGGVDYAYSHIGEYGKMSVLNSTQVEHSKIGGHFTCNGAEIKNTSIVGARTSIAGGSGEQKVIISKTIIGEGCSINTGTHIKNTQISPGKMIGKYMNIDGDYVGILQ